MTIPRATYRLQFHAGFTFEDAAALADYLAALGVSHIYASPYLQALPGSLHGYDVIDPNKLNEELGGESGHRRLCLALEEHGLGQILDIVPNHMAISGPENLWWWDVLENGPSSNFAGYFDVDWEPPEDRLSNKILLPILADHYGRAIEADEIQLQRSGGRFSVNYHEHVLPVAPKSLVAPLARAAQIAGSEVLAFLVDALIALPPPTATEVDEIRRRHRNKEVIRELLERLLNEDARVLAAVDTVVKEINRDAEALDRLLEAQCYRIAYWRTAERDLGYRRFFDINSLVGLRTEDEIVFADTHYLILGWLKQGVLDGVRIDHVDGLRDPEQYFNRLSAMAPQAWIVAEKILAPDEQLPASWRVHGTTGYDFLNLAGGLLVDPAGEEPLSVFYAEFTGETVDYQEVVREKKLLVMRDLLGSDLNRLTHLMLKICERHRRYRDYTRHVLYTALRELIACFSVYRTYVRAEAGVVSEQDRAVIDFSIAKAKEHQSEVEPDLFDFIRAVLFLEFRGTFESEFVMRFQQMTSPVTAKGVEDTTFYCYNRLVALNEVGGDPGRFGTTPDVFHGCMQAAAKMWPHTMLATSTHDTKRSEDVRARLYLLSEIPQRWTETVRRWSAMTQRYRTQDLPDRNTEYFIYQNLVGAWPIDEARFGIFMEKALREAKIYTTWTRINEEYEQAVREYITTILNDQAFVADLEAFVTGLEYPGWINSLAQTLIKLSAPGVPDIYQGSEIWELSLVDPDNRRAVDYTRRRSLLDALAGADPDAIMERMSEGLPKLWLIRQALRLRRERPQVFMDGGYTPLSARGSNARHVVAYLRADQVVAVVPRLVIGLNGDWGDTTVQLPRIRWRNVLTDESFPGGRIRLDRLLARFPVALLAS